MNRIVGALKEQESLILEDCVKHRPRGGSSSSGGHARKNENTTMDEEIRVSTTTAKSTSLEDEASSRDYGEINKNKWGIRVV